MAFQTFVIGRSRRADIRLSDDTVSRMHAELTLAGSGRLYLTDRGSLRGTWIRDSGEWKPHRQGDVHRETELRFGRFRIKLSDLLDGRSIDSLEGRTGKGSVSVRPRRNASSGEIEIQGTETP